MSDSRYTPTERRQLHQTMVDHLVEHKSELLTALAKRCQAATGVSRVTPEALVDLACWLAADIDALYLMGTLTNDFSVEQILFYREGIEE